MCKHGFSNDTTCSICNAPKGRTVTRMAMGSLAHKGKRRVKRVKHTRPPTWSDAAKRETHGERLAQQPA